MLPSYAVGWYPYGMTAPVQAGEILAGKYRVERVLGAGGMGVVVAAHHIELDERVALKFLLPEVLEIPEAVARFAREARAAAKIKSEHVARVTDVGRLANGAPYMVMEYLDGEDLSAWLQRGALPVEQAVEFVLQACEAIAEAHSLGIVHRDLKPSNLFCIRRPDGELSIKVLDFGISKALAGSSSGPDLGMTKTQTMLGSPLYMSPEQMQSARNVDARTDIWALGVILYQLLTARTPFDGETLPELVLNVATRPATPLRDLRPELPPRLVQVIDRCMEKQPGARYANVAELAAALAEFGPKRSSRSVERVSQVLQAAGLSANALASSDRAASAANAGTMAGWGQTTPDRARKTALVGTIVVVAIALLGAGAFFLHSTRTPVAAAATEPLASASASPATAAAPTTSASAEASPAVLPAPSASASAGPAASTSPPAAHAATPNPSGKPRVHHAAAARPAPKLAPSATRHPAVAPKYNPFDHL